MRRLLGPAAIAAALDAGEAVGCILVGVAGRDPPTEALIERARRAGIPVHVESETEMGRMSPSGARLGALGFVGRAPRATLVDVLAGSGVVWLLARADYPSNVGGAIRTAEVGGADAVVIDTDFTEKEKRDALRFSIHAERFMPVFWDTSATFLNHCAAAGRDVIAVEDSGDAAPWEVDLTGPVALVAGSERAGIPAVVLARCRRVIRLPMAGFIPAYNLQAAVAAVTTERLRQLAARGEPR